MEIFWRLVLAHLLADFTLQTNFYYQLEKEKYTRRHHPFGNIFDMRLDIMFLVT